MNWPKPDLAEFHLKLIAAEAANLADPVAIEDTQAGDLLRRLREVQRAAMAESDNSDAALLMEGVVLRLQADLHWLEACEQNWTIRRGSHDRHGHRTRRSRPVGCERTMARKTGWYVPSTNSTSTSSWARRWQ